jgi:hypothetical protein
MERRLEFMDVIVAVGLAATIVASGLLLMAANGMQISILGRESANNHTETDFLQPVLGQAIVDHVLLEHRHTREAAAAMTQLNRLVVEHNQWQHSAYGYLAPIANGASWAEAEHASRVQAVMGRSIVNYTRRGVRSGLWSLADRFAPGNPRMIRVTEARGETMHRAFIANWQPNIGREIIGATQDDEKRSTARQEQLGTAIVEMASVEEAYEPARAAIQEQLGSATVIATTSGPREGGVSSDSSDRLTAHRVAGLSAQAAFPGISTTRAFIAASLVLISLFTMGLFMFSPRRVSIS